MQKLKTKPGRAGRRKRKPHKKTSLAWMGWSLKIPEHWRPLKLDGGWTGGTVQISNGGQIAARVKWERLGRRRFNPDKGIIRILKKETGTGQSDANAPRPAEFSHAAWIRKHTTKAGSHGVWCGYEKHAEIVIQILFRSDEEKTRASVSGMIRSLRVSPPGEPFPLAVLGSRFRGPAGFRLSSWKLNLGDITLGLTSDSGQSLYLRQVYPASLALSRRKLERWVTRPLSSKHRRFKQAGGTCPYEVTVQGRNLKGVAVYGRKCFPFPLNRFRRMESMSAGIHDEKLDRLFLAACDMPGTLDKELVRSVFQTMDCTIRKPV